MTQNLRRGTRIIWIGVIVLIILRQDLWFWNDPSLVFGILPIGLAWQVGISIAAAILWMVAAKIAWPTDEPQEGSR
jgi:Na+/melibiose symporter-like transporter